MASRQGNNYSNDANCDKMSHFHDYKWEITKFCKLCFQIHMQHTVMVSTRSKLCFWIAPHQLSHIFWHNVIPPLLVDHWSWPCIYICWNQSLKMYTGHFSTIQWCVETFSLWSAVEPNCQLIHCQILASVTLQCKKHCSHASLATVWDFQLHFRDLDITLNTKISYFRVFKIRRPNCQFLTKFSQI